MKTRELDEAIDKANHAATFLRDDLMAANRAANPVEGLFLLNLIKRAAEIQNDLMALIDARAALDQMDHIKQVLAEES
ncbi:MAG: hypothetical protein OEQ39_02965 [Gammaproteobacteria bacterium]|nr:hypothetical protein [Gammaproteobacteria bacterium]MDH3375911.1 hypothetical protein [Gammaproteobacteria bacterium]